MLLSIVALSLLGVVSAAPLGYCDGGHRNGDRWSEGSFVKQCTADGSGAWSISVVGCRTPGGRQILTGSTATENGYIYSCDRYGNGATMNMTPVGSSSQIPSTTTRRGCENGRYEIGQEFPSSNGMFQRRCTGYNSYDIVACLADGNKIRVGSELTSNGYKYTCYKQADGTFRYNKMPVM